MFLMSISPLLISTPLHISTSYVLDEYSTPLLISTSYVLDEYLSTSYLYVLDEHLSTSYDEYFSTSVSLHFCISLYVLDEYLSTSCHAF